MTDEENTMEQIMKHKENHWKTEKKEKMKNIENIFKTQWNKLKER